MLPSAYCLLPTDFYTVIRVVPPTANVCAPAGRDTSRPFRG